MEKNGKIMEARETYSPDWEFYPPYKLCSLYCTFYQAKNPAVYKTVFTPTVALITNCTLLHVQYALTDMFIL